MQEELLEEFKKEFAKNEKKYFEKNFLTKPFYEALYENSRRAIIKLLQAQMSFIFLNDSIIFLMKHEEFFNTLGHKDKKRLKEMTKDIECIISDLDKILLPILKELS